jgi:flagellin
VKYILKDDEKMKINHNLGALNASNKSKSANSTAEKNMIKLSSGLRINDAGDDAAGLSISEKMRAQIRGLSQACRNIQDGISLVQTAEGGLNEMHALLQRGRELAIQAANDTNTLEDKGNIQKEINQIKEEVDKIARDTEFNKIKLLNAESTSASGGVAQANQDAIIAILYSNDGWIAKGLQAINSGYGLSPDNVDLKIILDSNMGSGVLADVNAASVDSSGMYVGEELHINMAYFTSMSWPNGGTNPSYYGDGVIAHDLTHAVMGRNMNFSSLHKWFIEGTGEFIRGADARLARDIYYANTVDPDYGRMIVVNEIGDGTDASWDDLKDFSAAYAAVRYLHDHIKAGGGSGIIEVMSYLKTNLSTTLDDALKNIAHGSYAGGEAAFIADFKANGANFIKTNMNLTNADIGAILGFDADNGPVKTAEDVILETGPQPTALPATASTNIGGFNVVWPSAGDTGGSGSSSGNDGSLLIQVGANAGEVIQIDLCKADSGSLGISDVDVITDPRGSITKFNDAINKVSFYRGMFGSIQNRLEYTQNIVENSGENLTSAESRIRDSDMAKEIMEFARNNILMQVSQSMISQANSQPESILKLLA